MMKLFFSFKGRIGRLSFFIGSIAVVIASAVIGGVVGGVMGASRAAEFGSTTDIAALQAEAAMGAVIVGAVVGLLSLWPCLALVVKRLHDLGRSGWTVLWMILANTAVTIVAAIATALSPAAGMVGGVLIIGMLLAWNVYLLFFKGTSGRNEYGMPPSGFTGSDAGEYDQVFA